MNHPFSIFALVAATCVASISCQKPVKPSASPEPEVETPTAVADAPEEIALEVEPEPEPIPREIPESEKRLPSLVIRESEAEKIIRFSGEMYSENQFEMLLTELGKRMPGVTLESDVTFDRSVKLTGWGNRADMLWLRFFEQVTDGIWRYSEGIVRMEGTTSKAASMGLERYTPDIMEGRDAKGTENQLTIAP